MDVDVHNGAHGSGEVDEDGDQIEEEASDQPSSPHALTNYIKENIITI